MKQILMMISVFMLFALPVYADSTAEAIDPDREISLTVHLEDDEAISGIGITIYRVADVSVYHSEGTDEIYGTAVYIPLIGDIDYDGMTAAENESAAQALMKEDLSSLVSYSGETDSGGDVTFSVLEKGAYLVIPTNGTDGFTFSPFIAFTPQCGEDQYWIYQVVCSPKTAQVADQEVIQTQGAKTGDRINPVWIAFAVFLSAGGALAAVYTNKRKRKGEIK